MRNVGPLRSLHGVPRIPNLQWTSPHRMQTLYPPLIALAVFQFHSQFSFHRRLLHRTRGQLVVVDQCDRAERIELGLLRSANTAVALRCFATIRMAAETTDSNIGIAGEAAS